MCGRGGLVRALAAEAVGERGARKCFAGAGESVDGDRDVLVDGTDNDDARDDSLCHVRGATLWVWTLTCRYALRVCSPLLD